MQNKKTMRVLTFFCILTILLTLFAGCNKEDDKTAPQPTDTVEQSTSLPEDMPEEARNYLPKKQDLGNYEYRMMVQYSSEDNLKYYLSEEGFTGDAISRALYSRNLFLEEYFNIVITVTSEGDNGEKTSDLIHSSVFNDEDKWDVCIQVAADTLAKNARNGDLLDINQMDGFNLDASYWDQRIQNSYAINGMLFCLEGDFTVLDELRTHGVVYNADLYEDFEFNDTYGSVYELVNSGKWTYDTMLEMFKNTSESNAGTMDKDSRWGMISESMAPYVFLIGSGVSVLQNDENGNINSIYNDAALYEQVYNTLDHVLYTFSENNTEVLFADHSKGVLSESSAVFWREASDMFKGDKALFRSSTLLDATWLVDMEARFGILPIPKYTAEQREYYSWTSSAAHAPLSIPRTVYTHDHLEKVVTVTEAMCYFSRYAESDSLYDAFFERMTVVKLCRTQDDYAMLERIYASKVFDLDSAFNFTRLNNLCISVVKGGAAPGTNGLDVTYSTMSSSMAGLKESSNANIQAAIIDILNNTVKIEQ